VYNSATVGTIDLPRRQGLILNDGIISVDTADSYCSKPDTILVNGES